MINVTDSTYNQKVTGVLTHLSSNQNLIQQPLSGSLVLDNVTGPNQQLKTEFQYDVITDSSPITTVDLFLTGIKLPKTEFYKNANKSMSLKSGNLEISSRSQFVGEELFSKSVIRAKDLRFAQKGIKNQFFI